MCAFVDTCACVYCLPGSNAVFLFVFCLDMALSFVMVLLCALNCPLETNKVFLNLNLKKFLCRVPSAGVVTYISYASRAAKSCSSQSGLT